MQSILEILGRIFLSRTKIKELDQRIAAAGLDMPTESFAGFLVTIIFLFSIAVAAFVLSNQPVQDLITNFTDIYTLNVLLSYLLALAISYIIVMIFLSSLLIVKSDARRAVLETALPDFLQLVSSNIKAGMPLDQAMWYAAKPEFGLLSIEVKSIVKRSFGGESLETALDMLTKRFDSKVFSRTITLIKQASATGGEVAAVLESTANDVRNTNIMRKDIAASLVVYEIFVLFAGMVGTPFLFAVAGKLIKVFEFKNLNVPTSLPSNSILGKAAFKISEPIITANDFFYFSIATILVTAFFSSFIVGVIRKGQKNEGIKYFPFVLIIAYLIFFLIDSVLTSFFTSLGG